MQYIVRTLWTCIFVKTSFWMQYIVRCWGQWATHWRTHLPGRFQTKAVRLTENFGNWYVWCLVCLMSGMSDVTHKYESYTGIIYIHSLALAHLPPGAIWDKNKKMQKSVVILKILNIYFKKCQKKLWRVSCDENAKNRLWLLSILIFTTCNRNVKSCHTLSCPDMVPIVDNQSLSKQRYSSSQLFYLEKKHPLCDRLHPQELVFQNSEFSFCLNCKAQLIWQ